MLGLALVAWFAAVGLFVRWQLGADMGFHRGTYTSETVSLVHVNRSIIV